MKVLDKDGLTYYTGKVKSTLTDYVKNTDYATYSKGGVIKIDGAYGLETAGGILRGKTKTYIEYGNAPLQCVISKGTLENVITGKGLVSNTSYANASTGGVFKTANSIGLNSSGAIYATPRDYTYYTNTMDDYGFISKGTLENVLTARIGNIETILTTLDIGSGAVEVL